MNRLKNWMILVLAMSFVSSASAVLLLTAARDGNLVEVKRLLDKKEANIEEKGFNGQTPLAMAAFRGNLDIVRELVSRGANVNAQSNNGDTVLMYAAENLFANYVEIIIELLNHDANINAKNNRKKTAVMLVLEGGHREAIKAIRQWSIENQTPITSPGDIKILDGNDPDSYYIAYKSYGVSAAEVVGPNKKELEKEVVVGPGEN